MKARGRSILSITENALFWCQYSNVLMEIRQEYGFIPHSSLKHYRTISALYEATERASRELYSLISRRAVISPAEAAAAKKRIILLCNQLISRGEEKKAHADAALLEIRQAQNSIAYCNLKHTDDATIAQTLTNAHSFQQSLFQQGQTIDLNEAQFSASDLFSCYRSFVASGLSGPSPYLPLNPLIYEHCYTPDFDDLHMKSSCGKTTSGFSLPEIVQSQTSYSLWLTPEQQQAFNIDEAKKPLAWSVLMDNSYATNIFYKSCSSFLGLVYMFDFNATFEDFCALNECNAQQRDEVFAYWTHSYNVLKSLTESLPIDEFVYFKLHQLEENSRLRYCPICKTLVTLGEECKGCHYDGFAWINFQLLDTTELTEPKPKAKLGKGGYLFPPNFFMKIMRDPISLLTKIQQMLRKASLWYNGLLKQKLAPDQSRDAPKETPKEQGHGILAMPTLTSSAIIGSGVLRWAGPTNFIGGSGDALYDAAGNLEQKGGTVAVDGKSGAGKSGSSNKGVIKGAFSAPLAGQAIMQGRTAQQLSISRKPSSSDSMKHFYEPTKVKNLEGKQSYSLFLRVQAEMSSSDHLESSDEVTVLYEQAQTATNTKPLRSSVRKQGNRRSSQENSTLSCSMGEHSMTGPRTEPSVAYDAISTNTDATEAGYCFCSRSNRKVCSDDMICCESNNCKYANEGWFHVDCLGLRANIHDNDIMRKLEDVEFYCPGCYVEILKKNINGWPTLFPFITSLEQRQALLEHIIKEWQENFSVSLERASRQIRREHTHLHQMAGEGGDPHAVHDVPLLGTQKRGQSPDPAAPGIKADGTHTQHLISPRGQLSPKTPNTKRTK